MGKKFKGTISLIVGIGFLMIFGLFVQTSKVSFVHRSWSQTVPSMYLTVLGGTLILMGILYFVEAITEWRRKLERIED